MRMGSWGRLEVREVCWAILFCCYISHGLGLAASRKVPLIAGPTGTLMRALRASKMRGGKMGVPSKEPTERIVGIQRVNFLHVRVKQTNSE